MNIGRILDSLDDHRDSLAATDASRRQSVASSAAVQLVQHCQNEPRACRTERMSERDRAAVDVSTAAIESELFFHSQILRRKSLVHFDEIDIVQRQTCFLQAPNASPVRDRYP